MPMSAIQAYAARLDQVQARWEMMLIEANRINFMKAEDQRNVLRRLQQSALGGMDAPVKVATPAKLALLGIKVEVV
jgi:hypothetical protein